VIDYSKLLRQVHQHPHPLLFAAISGAHLYGFPSPDSDFDLRGIHLLPVEQVLGLHELVETVERSGIHDGMEIDLVTHDVRKFFELLLRKNGYVLEQVLSPLVVFTTPEHEELKALIPGCLTKHHAHHYLGFAETQWKLFRKEEPPRVKPLLYVYRVLLTGIHLMRTGTVNACLPDLNLDARLSFLDDLIQQKLSGEEQSRLPGIDPDFHQSEYQRLVRQLEDSARVSTLPDQPSARSALSDLLVRLRLREWSKSAREP